MIGEYDGYIAHIYAMLPDNWDILTFSISESDRIEP